MNTDREQWLEKSLPHSYESEEVILGGIQMDNALMAEAAEKLVADDFYSPLHRRIFTAMLDLFSADKAIDFIQIGEELKKHGNLEAIGGVTRIANLTHGLPHFSDLTEYIKTVKDKSRVRTLIRICNQITGEALAEEAPVEELMDHAEQLIFDIANQREVAEAQHIYELAVDAAGEKIRQIKEGVPMTGRTTGLQDVDAVIGGYHKKNLVIVAGRPGMGKSALVTKSVVDGLIVDPGSVAALFTPEMSKEEVVERIICQFADMNLWRYRHNDIRESEWRHITDNIIKPFADINLYIDDTPRISVLQMLAKSRRIKAKHKRLDAVAVDHIGHMSAGAGKFFGETAELTKITGDLLAFAKTMEVPVIALSQLSRDVEKRNPPKPIMADLRQSGSIEQDAHVVMFVYRPGYYEKERAKKMEMADKAQIIIAKNRSGPTENVEVTWISTCAKFVDLARPDEDNLTLL